ncbi:hypothetical protein M947_02340 [Sulfurimonas hongkongensis]|uniref:Uncharacterized protein n=1 Tax=Sulfurimonas hongkongensis TaxID=1172190 RepID=T0L321_9BACT|nr:hypothetical protein [Sulfurimonas hongkongensis]EQB40193.1 hypothetical protein M947_02340 [Sulfurimonas hongkongensis]
MVINIMNETGGFKFIGSRGAGEIITKLPFVSFKISNIAYKS